MSNNNWTKLTQENLPDEWSTITVVEVDDSGEVLRTYRDIDVHEHTEEGVLWYRKCQTGYNIPELEDLIFSDCNYYWTYSSSIKVGDSINIS